ncbi:hypothetical protein MTO96_032625 [Rhipicephalus appendiculatus]
MFPLQDPSLMRGTLRDALDPTRSHSDQEVWLALHQVHLAEFICRHKDNIMMHVGDGGNDLRILVMGKWTGGRVWADTMALFEPRISLLQNAAACWNGFTLQ